MMNTYVVKESFWRAGSKYNEGDLIKLSKVQAGFLLAKGRIEDPAECSVDNEGEE